MKLFLLQLRPTVFAQNPPRDGMGHPLAEVFSLPPDRVSKRARGQGCGTLTKSEGSRRTQEEKRKGARKMIIHVPGPSLPVPDGIALRDSLDFFHHAPSRRCAAAHYALPFPVIVSPLLYAFRSYLSPLPNPKKKLAPQESLFSRRLL